MNIRYRLEVMDSLQMNQFFPLTLLRSSDVFLEKNIVPLLNHTSVSIAEETLFLKRDFFFLLQLPVNMNTSPQGHILSCKYLAHLFLLSIFTYPPNMDCSSSEKPLLMSFQWDEKCGSICLSLPFEQHFCSPLLTTVSSFCIAIVCLLTLVSASILYSYRKSVPNCYRYASGSLAARWG